MYGLHPDPAAWRDGDIDQDAERAARVLAWARDAEEELAAIVGEGEAGDGRVRVTTTADGLVREVVFAPRATRADSRTLAEELLLAVGRAQDDAERKARDLVAGALGEILPAGAPGPETVEEECRRLLRCFTRP